MTNEDTKLSLKLFIVLSRAEMAINEQTNRFFQQNGINPTDFAVLELLYHKGRQPLQKIGSKILLASGSITYVVDKLEKRGLLKRVSCSAGNRCRISQEGCNRNRSWCPCVPSSACISCGWSVLPCCP